jgi:hypothetical protein
MPISTKPSEAAGKRAATLPATGAGREAAARGGSLLERTRAAIRSIGSQLAVRRGNLGRLNRKK